MSKALLDTIQNLINGNLTDARVKAKRHSHRRLRDEYLRQTHHTFRTGVFAADYLKGEGDFGEFCAVKREEQKEL